jgi:hypothetical protein
VGAALNELDDDLADSVAAKLIDVLITEFTARQVPSAHWDQALINCAARMMEAGAAFRGVDYPEMLLNRLIRGEA